MMKIKGKKLGKKSLFKLIFFSMLIPMGLFFLLCGIAAAFGASTVAVNDQYETGWRGLLAAVFMFPLFVLIFSCVAWVFAALGLWMYSWFGEIEIEMVDGRTVGFSRAGADQRMDPETQRSLE